MVHLLDGPKKQQRDARGRDRETALYEAARRRWRLKQSLDSLDYACIGHPKQPEAHVGLGERGTGERTSDEVTVAHLLGGFFVSPPLRRVPHPVHEGSQHRDERSRQFRSAEVAVMMQLEMSALVRE